MEKISGGRGSHIPPVPGLIRNAAFVSPRKRKLETETCRGTHEPAKGGCLFKLRFIVSLGYFFIPDIKDVTRVMLGIARRSHPQNRPVPPVTTLGLLETNPLLLQRPVTRNNKKRDSVAAARLPHQRESLRCIRQGAGPGFSGANEQEFDQTVFRRGRIRFMKNKRHAVLVSNKK